MSRSPAWLPSDLILLDDRCPLPRDRPFTSSQAREAGVSRWFLRTMVERELVRPVLHGVYVAAQVIDTIEMRAAALSLVVPESAVVTDRTAAWLHGIDILPRWAMVRIPPIEVFGRTGSRLRRPGVASGTRQLRDDDVMVVDGVLVTTKLRTALDLGRSLNRFAALGALDAFLRAGVDHTELLGEVERYRGDRGVVQLRLLAPLADARAESPAESTLRLHWYDAGLPKPELQIWVYDDHGVAVFRIDLGLPELRYGAEYNGKAFHDEDRKDHDDERLEWLTEQRDWLIEVFVDADLSGPEANPEGRLRDGLRMARSRSGLWVPQGHYLR